MLTAHSRIRELETKVFDAQAETYVFQRRITQLEDKLLQLRASKSALATPSSERQSFNSVRPHTKVLASRPVYEDNLSAETRHKRRVSLSMLKARIESERAVMAATLRSPALSQIPIEEGEEGASTPKSEHSLVHLHDGFVRRQPDVFDDMHVFWCHLCKGDLVVL
ncbi:hypothetical protein M422DRAFT_274842 [Sphaerobolus stellatus SS14]|uniref:Uncharacterized protein n=1 Tax=Sphaerobolus stellatus (strain SS14) TaxID=990650 RepID=A0A0C9UGW0_SPHS4|nr:hypothetical protein M422DRAFT_274842 [Sphaerobolus stellatus SS14]